MSHTDSPRTMASPGQADTDPGAPRGAERTTHAAYGLLGLAGNLVGPALPALRGLLREDYAALALIFPANAAGSVVSLILGNRILDRLGYRRTLTLASGLYAVSLLSLGLTRALSLWLLELFIAGFAASLIDVTGARFVNVVHVQHRNRALNLLNLFYAMGSLLAPAAVSALAAGNGRIADLFIAAGLLAVLLTLATVWTFAHTSPFDQASLSPTLWDGWRWAVNQRWLLTASAAMACYVGAEVALAGWVSAYAHADAHLALSRAALFPLIFWAAMAGGRLLATERARRWIEEQLLWAGLAVSLAGTGLLLWPDSVTALVFGSALAGMGFAPLFPTLLSLAARQAPEHASEVFAVLFPAGAAGSLLVPLLAGELFAHVSPLSAMAIPAAAILGVTALTARFGHHARL